MPLPTIPYRTYQAQSSLDSPGEVVVRIDNLSLPLTLDPIPKFLWCGTAGLVEAIDIDGNVMEFLSLDEGLNKVRISELTSLDDASDIWALW